MNGAGAVAGLVLLEWSVGWVAVAAWSQSWATVRRGHFRIIGWGVVLLSALVIAAFREDLGAGDDVAIAVIVFGALALSYLLVQYATSDKLGATVGYVAGAGGAVALALAGANILEWPQGLAAAHLVAGAALLGGVTNGMLLGHWYLNQPGLKPWALARLTQLALVAAGAAGILGLISITKLAGASTEGSVLGLPGFGDSFGAVFYASWLLLLVFTVTVVWMARRCIKIRSIQSATGLYYVALLTAGVCEFLVRYLMVNAA